MTGGKRKVRNQYYDNFGGAKLTNATDESSTKFLSNALAEVLIP